MDENANNPLINSAWKLDHFTDMDGKKDMHYCDIMLFSGNYYSDYHSELGEKPYINSHVGRYKVIDSSITFNIQVSTDARYIGRIAVGTFEITNDTLIIAFPHGHKPGKWHYTRLT